MRSSLDKPYIREATPGDVPALSDLMTGLGYPTTEVEMRQRMEPIAADAAFVTLVAELDGEVVAMAGMQLSPSYQSDGIYARLGALVVSSTARGKGIGRALLRTCEERASRRGAAFLTLNSNVRREDAHRFYEKHGYGNTGYRFVKAL